ncbi:MAG: helix-turn-helix domain-containing protein [Planctomycetes bacterium]|nr:helix-turn-helix domain-containing protein [Planctomycetota bacterium]
MAEKGEFYSFEEALKELRLKEEELKRLVSEGEIRAFREGDTMKLRKADVENLRAELSGGEVVELGDVKEELVFEDDVEVVEDTGMATQEIGDVDTVVEEAEEASEEIELEGEEAAAAEAEEDDAPMAAPVVEVPEPYEGIGVRIAVVLTAVLLLVALPVVMSAGRLVPSGLAESIGKLLR